jgi:hypothetical protein
MSPPKSTEPEFTIHNAPPQPIKDGDDLDQIMHEVGTQLKKDDRKPPKRHLFSRKTQASHGKPVPAPPAANPTVGHAPVPAAQAPPKPKTKSSAPVLVITVTIIVTGILIAAAVSASK